MKHLSLTLVVVLLASALVSCKKKVEPVKAQPATEQTTERVSGTHAAIDIIWEESDLK